MRKKLKRSRKSNRVSWAEGDNLCQVKLFCSDDSPVKVGNNSEDDLEAKTSGMLHSGPNDLPPGFEQGLSPTHQGLLVPQIQWKCPPKAVLSHAWQVALGEESEEMKHQKTRETKVLEAVYPRFSSIPPCPSVSMELEREYYDDRQTPLVPLTPIEEEEITDSPSDSTSAHLPASPEAPSCSENLHPKVNSLPSLAKVNPDVDVATAAASAALAAIVSSNKKGSMIDTNLLIKIFRDPEMIQRLMANGSSTNPGVSAAYNTPTTFVSESGPSINPGVSAAYNTSTMFVSEPGTVSFSNPAPLPPRATVNMAMTIPSSAPEPSFRLSGGNPFGGPNKTSARPNMPIPVQPVKDVDYYKNLIRRHGGEKEENKNPIHAQNRPNYYQHQEPKQAHNLKQGDPKMISKPCMYFMSQRGCRKGLDCPFQHEAPSKWRAGPVMEANTAKRMKFNGDINGGMLV